MSAPMHVAVRVVAWVLALTLMALPVVGVLNGWFAAQSWPLRRLTLTAEFERVNAEQVRAAMAPHAPRGFFAVDLEAIRTAVSQLPWVADVQVRKHWPDTLEVIVREHRAVARWGEDRLLSERGELFLAPGAAQVQGIPALQGPEGRAGEVLALFRDAEQRLAGTGLRPTGLGLSRRGSYALHLDEGATVLLGRAAPQARLARFARSIPQILASEQRPLLRADLRYTNGFAIRWASPGEAADNGTQDADS
ncbi:MAG TPA: FtsQ-type POTRA domain-containing protein [Xanthomonadaceae bacterium]|nr:FtsQ-type POTRA domain-containing protein [Xanthomonadaceae bacterium]